MNFFSVSKKSLLIYQIIAHLCFAIFLFVGTGWQWAVAVGLYFLFSVAGGTVTYHRLLSHRSFSSPKWFTYLGTLLGTLGGNGSSIAWVAIHRAHHRYTDKDKDPHCPHHKGFFRVQFLSMLDTPNLKYVPDLLRSKFHVFVHNYYWLINLFYVAILFLIDPFAIIYAYFVPTLLVWHGGSLINTLNHAVGYRSNETKDRSTNNILTGYLVGGEGWHNNHHHSPADPQFGKKWWELDLGYLLIKMVRNG